MQGTDGKSKQDTMVFSKNEELMVEWRSWRHGQHDREAGFVATLDQLGDEFTADPQEHQKTQRLV